MKPELRGLHADIRTMSDRLDSLDEKVSGMQGYAKEAPRRSSSPRASQAKRPTT
jgi:hypothetical protein